MNKIFDLSEYRSVWESATNLPAGPHLRRRSSFPEYLSINEITGLLFEFADDEEIGERILHQAIEKGELTTKALTIVPEPTDPLEIIRNLHSHIKIIENEFREFQNDVTNLLISNITELEKDINELENRLTAQLRSAIENSRKSHPLEHPGRLNNKGLLSPKSQIPIRGGVRVGYSLEKQQPTPTPLVHRDDMKSWLKAKGEWPLKKGIPLKRWFSADINKDKKPLINTVRENILKMVANDLRGQGVNPLVFPGTASEVFELCRQKSIAEDGNAHAFTAFNTWRKGFWNKGKPPRHMGIIELADSRSHQQKS